MCGRFFVSEAELDDFAALVNKVEKDLYKPRPNDDGTGDVVPGDFSPIIFLSSQSKMTNQKPFQENRASINHEELHNTDILHEHKRFHDHRELYDSETDPGNDTFSDNKHSYSRDQSASFPSAQTSVLANLTVPYEVKAFSWGFPSPYNKSLIINARAETVTTKPMFRQPFITHRCIIPISGFYEWSDECIENETEWSKFGSSSIITHHDDAHLETSDGRNSIKNRLRKGLSSKDEIKDIEISEQMTMMDFSNPSNIQKESANLAIKPSPYFSEFSNTPSNQLFQTSETILVKPDQTIFFSEPLKRNTSRKIRYKYRFIRMDGGRMWLGGLYWDFEHNHKPFTAFTIITVPANIDMIRIHDRMPFIIEENNIQTWLSSSPNEASELLHSSAKDTLLRRSI